MDLDQLNEYLYRKTPSEIWHLEHPGRLSQVYAQIPRKEYHGEKIYYFDFKNTLKTNLLGIVKETRYTTIPPHFHKDMEINYIYSGSCTFIINNQEIKMNQGDLCILDSNVVHSAISQKEDTDIVINIVFRKEFFDYIFLSHLSNKGIISDFLSEALANDQMHNQFLIFHTLTNFKIHSLIQFLLTEYFDPSACIHELMEAYFIALFTELINTTYSFYTKKDDKNDKLFPILKYIANHYQDCTLTSTASYFGYSSNYLSNYLKKNTGRSFMKIKTSQQMAEAGYLLTNSDYTIEEIAGKVGSNNLTYFYKKFEETYHMLPKEYRLQNKYGKV